MTVPVLTGTVAGHLVAASIEFGHLYADGKVGPEQILAAEAAQKCGPPPSGQVCVVMVCAIIRSWCLEHIGQELLITNVKDFGMYELWDDRAVTVEPNTGRVICHPVGVIGATP